MAADDRDSPWKELLDQDLKLALELLAPQAHQTIDWTQGQESLEQELRKMVPASLTGKRLADKLIKAVTPQGDERHLHVEVQGKPEKGFGRRVYVYHYRIDDRFGVPPETIVILADDHPTWRPRGYRFRRAHSRLTFRFEPVKILDWAGREEELEAHSNPVGLFVLAHVYSQRTRKDPGQRFEAKLRLILNLRARKMPEEDLRHWYRYLDWFLPLPPDREDALWERLREREQEDDVPFISYPERREQRARQDGRVEGLLKGIELGLRLKFKDEGLPLLAELKRQTDPALLESVLAAIENAASPEEIRRLLPPVQDHMQPPT